MNGGLFALVEPEQELERLSGPRPVSADNVAGNRATQSLDQEHYEYCIVKLPGDRYEVWHEIERQGQVGQNSDDCEPIGAAQARIANEAAE